MERKVHLMQFWTSCPEREVMKDSHTVWEGQTTCPSCLNRIVAEKVQVPSYPKSREEDRARYLAGEFRVPYGPGNGNFCFGNPFYADCHMKGSCHRRYSCSN